MPSRMQALGVVLVVWAAIYLPALGSLPIKGEEGRRILPAMADYCPGAAVLGFAGVLQQSSYQ